jgi:hypothetical protein
VIHYIVTEQGKRYRFSNGIEEIYKCAPFLSLLNIVPKVQEEGANLRFIEKRTSRIIKGSIPEAPSITEQRVQKSERQQREGK